MQALRKHDSLTDNKQQVSQESKNKTAEGQVGVETTVGVESTVELTGSETTVLELTGVSDEGAVGK